MPVFLLQPTMPMSDSSYSLDHYRRSARSLAAKASLPLAAAAAAAALPASADATVIVTQFSTDNVVNYTGSLFIDIDGGRLSSDYFSGYDFKIEIGSVQYPHGADHVFANIQAYDGSVASRYRVDGAYILTRLSGSTSIDSALFAQGASGSAEFNPYKVVRDDMPETGLVDPDWSSTTGYIGLKFNAGDSYIHYGWLKVSTNADASSITLLAMGYNDAVGETLGSGEGLVPVPEPATSAALLALGAAGLVAYRQRKKLRRAAA